MTNEKVIEVRDCRNCKYGGYNDYWGTNFCHATEDCVDWNLWESSDKMCEEQNPCEDCISRQKVNELVDELARAISDERCFISRGRDTANIMQDILDLPSVTLQPKIGHWKRVYNDQWLLKCPFCEHAFIEHQMPHKYDKNYCPSCGAKMIEPIENNTE